MKKFISIVVLFVLLISTVSCNTNQTLPTSKNDSKKETKRSKYTVYFETNGGTPVEKMHIDKIEKAPLTARDDYYFIGWYLNNSLTEEAKFPLKITKNTTLYAKWEKVKYNVYFEENNGKYKSNIKADTLTEVYTPEMQNCLFDGWYTDKNLKNKLNLPLDLKNDITLYAKWLKLKDSIIDTEKTTIDAKFLYTEGIKGNILPKGFDFKRLSELDYNVKIVITYEVYYTKDYDVLWDIGYLGAPKFETYIIHSGTKVFKKENQTAQKAITTYSITYKTSAYDLYNENLEIQISTNNIQNKIHIQNLKIDIECYK